MIGVPDDRMGEELCAWVRLSCAGSLEEKELREFCKGKVERFPT